MVNLRENKVICSCGHFMSRWYLRKHNDETCRRSLHNALGCRNCGKFIVDEEPLPSDLTVIPSIKWKGLRCVLGL